MIHLANGTEDNGLAQIIGELIRQNLIDHPEKQRDLDRLLGRVAIVAEDAGVALTMTFERGQLTLHDGIVGIPDVTIRASSEDITKMSLVELATRFRLPDPRGSAVREVAAASREGRIRVYGMWANLPLLLRLTRLMSVH